MRRNQGRDKQSVERIKETHSSMAFGLEEKREKNKEKKKKKKEKRKKEKKKKRKKKKKEGNCTYGYMAINKNQTAPFPP